MNSEYSKNLMGDAPMTEEDAMRARQEWWKNEFGACMRDNRAAAFASILAPLAMVVITLFIGIIACLLIGGMPAGTLWAFFWVESGLIVAIVVILAAYFFPERRR